ncbi:hypothetical protein JAAARDRAFT_46436 [Jaapia argillacea MUCL 33604]|uniref:Uncharacterized protein n=1 Tax=Jaapia argillacea MUCL 33604 TaxID=933084 RepID=A0A067PYC8_9AGAM|nr:hypothetical protein JAAARDRAFT_46436 [Jaapia argillacea MUCL 33604]
MCVLKGIFRPEHPSHPPQNDPPCSRTCPNSIEEDHKNFALWQVISSDTGLTVPPPTQPFQDKYTDYKSFLGPTEPLGLEEEDHKKLPGWQVISPDADETVPPPRNTELEQSRVVTAQGSQHPETLTQRAPPPKADRHLNKILSPPRGMKPPPPPPPASDSSSHPTSPGPSRYPIPTVPMPGRPPPGQSVTYTIPTDHIEYPERGVFIPLANAPFGGRDVEMKSLATPEDAVLAGELVSRPNYHHCQLSPKNPPLIRF